jgi:hypothetical protein
MSIRINVVLSEEDAANVLDILNTEKCRILSLVLDEMAGDNRKSYKDWYQSHAKYIQGLADKLSQGSTLIN